MSEIEETRGALAIKDGKIIIREPAEAAEPPVLVPGKNVTVMVDNKVVEKAISVNSQNKITLIPKIVQPLKEVLLNISEDKLTVSIKIKYKPGERYIVEDSPFAERLVVDCYNSDPIDEPFTVQEVIKYLNDNKVTYGINRDAIQEAIETGNEIVVAKGLHPQSGKNGWIEDLVSFDVDTSAPEEGEGIIRDRSIVMVKEGQKIAKVHPPIAGKPGINIHGLEIPPPLVKEAKLIAGNGTYLDGVFLISKIEGRLDKQLNKYSVYPVYNVEGDADAKEGYIKFSGDVIVKGNVLDGMKIHATRGKIEIFGYAANSTLIASGDVIVHNNLVSCTVKAGGADLEFKKAKESLDQVAKGLKDLIKSAKNLKATLAARKQTTSDGTVIKILLDQKLSNLPNAINTAFENLKEVEKQMESENLDVKNLLKVIEHIKSWQKKLSGLGPMHIKKVSDLEYSLAVTFSDIRKFLADLNNSSTEHVVVKCSYIQNSDIQVDGDVVVNGKGCYNTKILATGNIEISGSPGVFKGGSITAKGWVKAREIGSIAEIPTFIQVDKKQYIKAGYVFPGTILKCGPRIEKITDEINSLYFKSEG